MIEATDQKWGRKAQHNTKRQIKQSEQFYGLKVSLKYDVNRPGHLDYSSSHSGGKYRQFPF
jgi:hypothetical protein